MAQLITCPECKKHLQVPEDLMGKKVQCPECKHTFTAAVVEVEKISTGTTASAPVPPPSSTPEWEKKTSSATGKRRDSEEDDPDIRKKKRKRDDDDEDDDDDDRPRRRRRRSSAASRGSYMPHRGGMILAFGLISMITGIFVFGILAWVMGNGDLAEIRAGRMDPEGEGLTQAGRILGMISTILTIVGVLGCCGFYGVIILIAVAG
ncbi:MAG: hypothetical protein EXR98_08040 [Gemmataceae bacterium]|nr:hypothetical protein [Gemmataceae bacterium]